MRTLGAFAAVLCQLLTYYLSYPKMPAALPTS